MLGGLTMMTGCVIWWWISLDGTSTTSHGSCGLRLPEWAWDRYYALAAKEDVSRLRVAAMGVVVHLVVDLPHSLTAIDTWVVHYDDFMLFGICWSVKPTSSSMTCGRITGWIPKICSPGSSLVIGSMVPSAPPPPPPLPFRPSAPRHGTTAGTFSNGGVRQLPKGEISVSFWTLDGILKTLDGAGTI